MLPPGLSYDSNDSSVNRLLDIPGPKHFKSCKITILSKRFVDIHGGMRYTVIEVVEMNQFTEKDRAILSSGQGFSIFQFGKRVIRFKAPYSLERYTKVKHWDNGYLVVDAKYAHNRADEEEYIDLIPILEDLYIDPHDFLDPIKGVEIAYD